jgi:hypothetical protein
MAEIPIIDDSIPMFEWFNGPMVGGFLGVHISTPTFGSPKKEGRKARAGPRAAKVSPAEPRNCWMPTDLPTPVSPAGNPVGVSFPGTVM